MVSQNLNSIGHKKPFLQSLRYYLRISQISKGNNEILSKAGFLSLNNTDILGGSILSCRGGSCSMHDRISSDIPGLYPTVASNTHPPLVIDIQNIPLLGRGAKPPPLRTTVLEGDTKPFTD